MRRGPANEKSQKSFEPFSKLPRQMLTDLKTRKDFHMGFRLKASAAQVGIVVIALAVLGTSVQAQGQQRTDKLGTGPAPVVVKKKKDIWGDPDAFLAKCNAAGGGASTDDVGLPHCEDANGGNIPIPMDD